MIEFINSDFVRWLNVAASCIVVALITMGTYARWEYLPPRFRRILPWIVMTYGIIAYGSAEVALSDAHPPQGYRVVMMLLTLCGLVIALLYGITDKGYVERESETKS